MSNEKYDSKKLTEIALGLYHAYSGQKPDEDMKERIGAGVEAAVMLYEINPKLLYALGEAIAPMIDQYLANTYQVKMEDGFGQKLLTNLENLLK